MTPPSKQAALAIASTPAPHDVEERAQRLRLATSNEHKKTWGQYFTPPVIAEFMAALSAHGHRGRVRILDPGAGTGVLGLTLARMLLKRRSVEHVDLYCVESEPQARAELESALASARADLGRRFSAATLAHDFLEFAAPRLGAPGIPPIDVAIANPPYFKLSPKDTRGGDAPNIYARFMEVAAKLLRDDGRLCFVVPRSYTSGHYFRRFRRRFHHTMQLEHVHLFESRSAAFKADAVLQENVIVLYAKQRPDPSASVSVSVSESAADLSRREVFRCRRSELLSADESAVVSLPTSPAQLELMKRIQALPNTLETLGLQISTGPVVPFRSTEFLVDAECEEPSVPLLWLQHVRRDRVTWPLAEQFRKPEHIRSSAGSKLLVPTANYVLLRRFSAKEEARRLTAAPLLAKDWSTPLLGLENHLNYIHGSGTSLTPNEARGLSTLLNSQTLDDFFRISSGNTQVSATEVRTLPLPSRAFIRRLGRASISKTGREEQIERLIEDEIDDAGR